MKNFITNMMKDATKKAVNNDNSVTGKVVNAIFSDDIDDLGSYIKNDIIVPHMKNEAYKVCRGLIGTINNSLSDTTAYLGKKVLDTAQMNLFGSVSDKRNFDSNPSYRNQGLNYNNMYRSSNQSTTNANSQVNTASNIPSTSSMPKIVYFHTRGEAEQVLYCLNECIARYGQVRVADYYEYVQMDSQSFTDNNYGWKNLDLACIRRSEGMTYYIKLPRPIALN